MPEKVLSLSELRTYDDSVKVVPEYARLLDYLLKASLGPHAGDLNLRQLIERRGKQFTNLPAVLHAYRIRNDVISGRGRSHTECAEAIAAFEQAITDVLVSCPGDVREFVVGLSSEAQDSAMNEGSPGRTRSFETESPGRPVDHSALESPLGPAPLDRPAFLASRPKIVLALIAIFLLAIVAFGLYRFVPRPSQARGEAKAPKQSQGVAEKVSQTTSSKEIVKTTSQPSSNPKDGDRVTSVASLIVDNPPSKVTERPKLPTYPKENSPKKSARGLLEPTPHFDLVVFHGGQLISNGASIHLNDLGNLGFTVAMTGSMDDQMMVRVEWWVDDIRTSHFELYAGALGQPVAYDNKPWAGRYEVRLLFRGHSQQSLSFTVLEK